MASSKLFLQIYYTLPPEQQQAFVEEHLAPLLDTVSPNKRDRIIKAAQKSQAHFNGAPVLDFKAKRREVQTLLIMLSKDDKVAFSLERSNREEILQEAVHSLSSWLDKIWLMVYEYKANFQLAHECLLYVAKGLVTLEDSPAAGDCRCLFNNMHVSLALKDSKRRTVKYFSFTGPRNLDQACLWIWRDLFISMLVNDHQSSTRVKEMLLEIEEIMGWPGLEQMLYGGRRRSEPEDEDDEYSDVGDEDDFEEEGLLAAYEDVGTDDEYDLDGQGYSRVCCRFHAKYWSNEMNEERITLREIVKTRLVNIFREAPDPDLFGAIGSISQDPTSRTTKMLLQILDGISGDSVESLRAALVIYTGLRHPCAILKLLEDHYHHLRPHDCPILLPAVAVLANSIYVPDAIKFIEGELIDSVRHSYFAIRSAFSSFSEEINKTDLTDLLKLPADSPDRAGRIQRWVDRVLTPVGSEPMGTMAFAAMMMGFPVGPPPGYLDEANLLAYIDLDKPDSDFDDLREEFKPQLKARFESWNLFAQSMAKDRRQINHKVYMKIIETMPFFKAEDVVAEMADRLNRPNKCHIMEAMVNISAFCRVHRKAYLERRRTKLTAQKTTTSKNTTAQPKSTPTGAGAAPSTPANNAPNQASNSAHHAPNPAHNPASSPAHNPSPNPAHNHASSPAPNPSPAAPSSTAPIFHFFAPGTHGTNVMPFASFYGNPLPHPLIPNNAQSQSQSQNQHQGPANPSQSQPQSQGQGHHPPVFSGPTPPFPPPPECHHQ